MKIAFCLFILFCRFSLCFASHGHHGTKIHMDINDKLKMIHDILQQRSHFTNNKCGTWKDNYLQHYKQLVAKPESERQYLVAVPNLSGTSFLFCLFSFFFCYLFSGMADRVLGFTTVFIFAILSNRIFQIGRRHSLPNMEAVFSSPNINWTRNNGLYEPDWIVEPLQHKAKLRNYNTSILETKKYNAVNTIDDWRLQDRFLRQNIIEILGKDYQTVFIVMNRGKTIRIFENSNYQNQLNEMGITPHTAFGCLVEFLISPKPFIFLPVIEQLQTIHSLTASYLSSSSATETSSSDNQTKNSTLVISIQIRTGDEFLVNQPQSSHQLDISQYVAYFHCAKQIEDFVLASKEKDPLTNQQYSNVKWYLVTDSLPLRKLAVDKYGSDKIVTNTRTKIEHSSKESSVCQGQEKSDTSNCEVSLEGFANAAAEWWLMSYSRYHVITRYRY
jgi:hypothetical protein